MLAFVYACAVAPGGTHSEAWNIDPDQIGSYLDIIDDDNNEEERMKNQNTPNTPDNNNNNNNGQPEESNESGYLSNKAKIDQLLQNELSRLGEE